MARSGRSTSTRPGRGLSPTGNNARMLLRAEVPPPVLDFPCRRSGKRGSCRPPPTQVGSSPIPRISVCSCFGAEAPAQGARRKPQAASSLASPGLQSGEDRSLLLILALVRKHPVAGGPAALRRLKSAAPRFQESAFALASVRKHPRKAQVASRKPSSAWCGSTPPRPSCLHPLAPVRAGGSREGFVTRPYLGSFCFSSSSCRWSCSICCCCRRICSSRWRSWVRSVSINAANRLACSA